MPSSVRKDDKAKRIVLNILGVPPAGVADSFGNKKKYKIKKEENAYQDQEQEENYPEDYGRIQGW